MSLFPNFTNTAGLTMQSGENLILDLILLDDRGKQMPLIKWYPEDPENAINMVLDWRLQDLDTRSWLLYSIDDGVTIINANIGHIQLNIPANVLKSNKGYRYTLMGWWDDTNQEAMKLLAKGMISILNPSLGSVVGSDV